MHASCRRIAVMRSANARALGCNAFSGAGACQTGQRAGRPSSRTPPLRNGGTPCPRPNGAEAMEPPVPSVAVAAASSSHSHTKEHGPGRCMCPKRNGGGQPAPVGSVPSSPSTAVAGPSAPVHPVRSAPAGRSHAVRCKPHLCRPVRRLRRRFGPGRSASTVCTTAGVADAAQARLRRGQTRRTATPPRGGAWPHARPAALARRPCSAALTARPAAPCRRVAWRPAWAGRPARSQPRAAARRSCSGRRRCAGARR